MKDEAFSSYMIKLSLLVFIFYAGCVPANQTRLTSLESEKNLVGCNHISTIKGNFSRLAGIAVDMERRIYVVDSGRSTVHVLDYEGNPIQSLGSFGWQKGEFDNPMDVCIDSQLRLYIADNGNNRVQSYSLASGDFRIIVGEKSSDSFSKSFALSGPMGLATDTRGDIYIADTWNHRILKTDILGRLLMESGGFGQFSKPQSLVVGADKSIYVCDTGNSRICKLDLSGRQIARWGIEGAGKSQFRNPTGVSLDKFGNIYVVDQGNKRIQIFSPNGRYLLDFGDQHLSEPIDIAIDNELRAYVTDVSENSIEVFKIIISEKS